ncbi:alpha-tocopherol transfer protein-like [Anticarsia gemmatalis]|uniref:alpha-tocopherol transfer protein-like n=1 Tax=Anticarsia gemmatalis TaxID=129554 RepID=UPI003F76C88E
MSYEDFSPLYPHNKEDIQEIRGQLGLKDSTIQEDVDAIIEWFQKQPHLVEAGIDRDVVERMLIVAKGSIEKTKRRIDNWYKFRLLAPEIVQGRDKVLSDSQDLWTSYLQIAMPKLYKGHRVAVIKFVDPEPSNFSCETFLRNTFMLADIRLKYDYFLDDIWVLDMKNTSFAHLLRLNPALMQKSANLFHEGLGLRIHSIHVLNATNLIQHVITFMKQFFSPKIMERVIIHESLDDLHMSLPKRYLPKDYGGEEKPMAEFKDMYEKELRSSKTKQFLINSMKLVSNEKKRPDSDINEDYLAGSFRKLDFD